MKKAIRKQNDREKITMRTSKRGIFSHLACFVVALILLLGNICGALAEPSKTVLVTMDLQLRRNMIFAKYGATMYVDDQEIDSMANGGRLIKILELNTGIHTITLRAKKDGVQDFSFDVYVAENTSLSAIFQAHRKYININSMVMKTENHKLEYDDTTDNWEEFVSLLLYYATKIV